MRSNDESTQSISQSYAPDLYDALPDEPARANFDDFVNELEHNMIQLRLLFPTTDPHELNDLISTIWENSRDLTDPFFTNQAD